MSTFRLLLLATFVCSALAACSTKWIDCGSLGGKIDAACIVGCSGAPCVLHSGKPVSMWYTFTPTVEYADLTQTAWGDVLNVWLQLSGGLEPPDVCKLVKCPLEVGKTYNVSTQLTVPPVPAEIKLDAEIRLDNRTGIKPPAKTPICIEFQLLVEPN